MKEKILEGLAFVLSLIAVLLIGAFLIFEIYMDASYNIILPTIGFFITNILLMARIIIRRS